ncbi:DNA polymerase III subunit gamma and tau [Lachnospiraceae bacterium TWA4]|nr:DNA polymerase III subunit gamma and tau [Lachnospiraceae bacterium TWA4]
MAYTALYRKWRPQTFLDVRGQDPIVTALKNQIKTGRMGHAYLFCGTRGTGKTSIAKIFARALNCEHPVDGNPCNECESCKSALAGSNLNVVEIDAASNNGVDNIREIREEVRYAPTQGKYKVYIIDEVHMLSTGAFNALLKTLEEPPAHVIFILATTEAYKIPITVLSRCQRYDFRRISLDVIAGRLLELINGEQLEIEEKALRYIARKADGSLRDAISLLDQCIAFHFGEKLTYESVLDVLGSTSYEVFSKLLQALLDGKSAECIYQIDEIVMQGRELSQLVSDFIWYLRNLMLLKSSDLDADTLEVSEEELLALGQMASAVEMDDLLRYIREFSELLGKIRNAVDKRVQLEMTFMRLTNPSMDKNIDSLVKRIEDLEKKLEQGVVPLATTPIQQEMNLDSKSDSNLNTKPEIKPIVKDENLLKEWNKLIEKLTGRAEKIALRGSFLQKNGENGYTIFFDDEGKYVIANRDTTKKELEELAVSIYNKPIVFTFSMIYTSVVTSQISVEEVKQVFHGINIETE